MVPRNITQASFQERIRRRQPTGESAAKIHHLEQVGNDFKFLENGGTRLVYKAG